MNDVTCTNCGADLAATALFCSQCGRAVEADALTGSPASGKAKKKTAGKKDASDADSTAKDVPAAPTGERFVLQFSTGESVTVFGTGLIGRHPVAEPGEYFDQTVTIVDASRSVSKTHLEFGQSSGALWISDRFSGNGTIIREPDSEPRRCDAGKRYRIARGTRVSIGEQFFVVS